MSLLRSNVLYKYISVENYKKCIDRERLVYMHDDAAAAAAAVAFQCNINMIQK